jgi:nucleoside 2-deoxyribosyltransferase
LRSYPKVYLAGPDVFRPDAGAIGQRKTDLCAEFGFEGSFPLDDAVASCGIVNLTPFRGPSADVGSAFELGVLVGLGKPCFAYTNDDESMLERLQREGLAVFDEVAQRWVDRCGMAIEDFGNADNLMLDSCLAERMFPIVRRRCRPEHKFTDLGGFVACLELARTHFAVADKTASAARHASA